MPVQKVKMPADLIREAMVIIGCTMTAIVQEDDADEYSTDGDSISLNG